MIKAVLLDMDNTLLFNPDVAFAQNFIMLFERHFEDAGFENVRQNLRTAIQAMGSEQQGNITNLALALKIIGKDNIDYAKQVLNTFYTDVYPNLKHCIKPVDGVAELIYRLKDMGLEIVIATNPIYPEIAIRQRMKWANLPLDDDLYHLITSADIMHFAKPDPAYYAEILGRVGVEPDETLMVGDSVRNDIIPAQTIGIRTIKVENMNFAMWHSELNEALNQSEAFILKPQMIEPQLRGNIGALYGFIDTVQSNYWHQRPDPKEWSILQILCHLLESEENNERRRLRTILEHDNPFIIQREQPGPDIKVCNEDGYQILQDFMRTRQTTIEFIKGFTVDDWARPARHSIFGLTTMLEMAYFTAQHDRLHLKQLCQTIGQCE